MISQPNFKKNDGQILVIILLVMVAGLTVGLFTVRRTVTDVSSTSKIEESTRAFNAAEAGIEESIRSLVGVSSSPVPVSSGVTYSINVADLVSGASGIYPSTKDKETKINDAFTVWLVAHNDTTGALIENKAGSYNNNLLDICFTGNTPTPAVAVSFMYKDTSTVPATYKSSFSGYDPDAARNNTNMLKDTVAVGACGGAAGYTYRATINFTNDFGVNIVPATIIPLAVRIRPLYGSSSIAVLRRGVASIPKQGSQIRSTGQAGETARRIQISEQYTVPAPFLDYTLYSKGASDLTK